MNETVIDIDAHGVQWREAVGEALHEAFHPGHEWAACSDPDRVYEKWMPRLLTALHFDGYEIALIPVPKVMGRA